MKINILVLAIIAVGTYFVTIHFSEKTTPIVNQVPDKKSVTKTIQDTQKIPDFTFMDIKGKTYQAYDFQGKIIILNFWASWCAPCIKEFPNLLDIVNTNKDDVVLIALSSDLDETAIHKFIQKMQINKNFNFDASNIFIALDENQAITAKKFQTFKLPETIIIDQNLNMRHKLIGANWELGDLEKIIEELKLP